jgi:NAD dependent epimerase/dehydratase family enzyme
VAITEAAISRDDASAECRSWDGGQDEMTPIRIRVVAVALSIACGSAGASLTHLSATDQSVSGTLHSSKRMSDGKQWMTDNLTVNGGIRK